MDKELRDRKTVKEFSKDLLWKQKVKVKQVLQQEGDWKSVVH
jgi:hypothetical protein